jgi:hypothetical protein
VRNIRPLHWCVMALVSGSLLLGVVYLTTGGAGGLSLGVLFLLGGALLHLIYRLQQEVREVKALLAVIAYRHQPLGSGNLGQARGVSAYNLESN